MPSVFEQYQGYHYVIDDTDEMYQEELRNCQEVEREIRSDPAAGHWREGSREGYRDSGGNPAPYPVQAQRMRMVFSDAEEQLTEWGHRAIYPDDPDIGERFPGVDPFGKYSEIDMGFSQRLERLRVAKTFQPAPVQEYVDRLLEGYTNQETDLGKRWSQVVEMSMRYRTAQRAAKRAVTEEDSQWFQEENENRKKDRNIQIFDSILHVAEYAAGLTDREPAALDRSRAAEDGFAYTPELERMRPDAPILEEGLQIGMKFADFDHVVTQRYFADPEYWDKGQRAIPKDALSVEEAEKAIGQYAQGTAERYLSPLFRAVEERTKGLINRSELIIVDGRPVQEILEQRYEAEAGRGSMEMSRQEWLQENQARMTNEIVAAGLMAGKRVEAFVPDARGRIPREPVQIVKEGYEPEPLKKVTLSAWERHFAKHGFYKEKAAQAVEYKRTMEARERVRTQNQKRQIRDMDSLARPNIKEQFFGEWMKENGPLPEDVPGGFHVGRSTFSSMAVCAMAREGFRVEQIMDPGWRKEEKAAICKEVIDRMAAGDKEWEAKTLYEGCLALNREMDTLLSREIPMEAGPRPLDITNEKELFSQAGRPLFFVAQTLFDAGQEKDNPFIREALNRIGEAAEPGRAQEALDRVFFEKNSMVTYLDFARGALEARMTFQDGPQTNLVKIAAWEYARGLYTQKKEDHPEVPAQDMVDMQEFYFVRGSLGMNKSFRTFADRVAGDPAAVARLHQAAVRGELGRQLKVTGNERNLNFRVEAATPAQKKAERTEQRIQEAVEKEAAAREREQAERRAQKAVPVKQTPKAPVRGRR